MLRVKQNARTSAEPALNFSYVLFEEGHCGIEVVHFDFSVMAASCQSTKPNANTS